MIAAIQFSGTHSLVIGYSVTSHLYSNVLHCIVIDTISYYYIIAFVFTLCASFSSYVLIFVPESKLFIAMLILDNNVKKRGFGDFPVMVL